MKHVALFLFLATGLASAADDADSKQLLKDLEGTYKMTAAEHLGGPAPAGFLESIELVTIKGNKLSITFKGEGGKVEEKMATILIDASKKPAQIDLKADEGEKKDHTVQGIVLLKNGTLKICWNDRADAKRPADFKTSKDDKSMLLTLKKSKQ